MQCEICGRPFRDGGSKIRVEGAVVIACDECSHVGHIVGPAMEAKKTQYTIKQKPIGLDIETGMEIIENYSSLIREARERRGMKQEDLAKAINEQLSVIRRLESGHMKPSIQIAKKVGHALDIWLFEKDKSDAEKGVEFKTVKHSEAKELTLGDMVFIKKKKDDRY